MCIQVVCRNMQRASAKNVHDVSNHIYDASTFHFCRDLYKNTCLSQENAEYEVSWRGSLYPTTISRAHSMRARHQWAWTLGSPRFVNEAFYAVEIVATDKGAIHLGIATDDIGNKGSKKKKPESRA